MSNKSLIEKFIAQQSLGGAVARLLMVSEPRDFGDGALIGPGPSISRGPLSDGLAIRVGEDNVLNRNATSRSKLLLLGVHESLVILLVEFHGLANLETVHVGRCIGLASRTRVDFGIGNLAHNPDGANRGIVNMSTDGKKAFLVGKLLVLGLVRNVLEKFFEGLHLKNTDRKKMLPKNTAKRK